ncbi:MAG: hypothetical protein HY282_15045 [Nitrospirae bacterium]|nr:hypothetical protein [Candidatus Manganitrophaceae bacterium]
MLIILFLAVGCGKGKSGVIVDVTTTTPGITPLSKIQAKILQDTTGDGGTDAFPDRNLTPQSFTIAFNSFRLFQALDNTLGTNVGTAPSYTVFDVGTGSGVANTRPLVVSLTTGLTTQLTENKSDPAQGTYDHVQYEIRYFEMTIPLCSANDVCEDHRLRFYLTADPDPDLNNFTPVPGAILISRSPNATDFSWVSITAGLPLSLVNFPITGGKPTDPYLIPITQFQATNGAISSIFNLPISPVLEIKSKPEKEFVFTLAFDLINLFFFDNTDETNNVDPGPDFHFNALIDPNSTVSRDGKILQGCATTIIDPSVSALCQADFWPGIPLPTVSVTEQDRNN